MRLGEWLGQPPPAPALTEEERRDLDVLVNMPGEEGEFDPDTIADMERRGLVFRFAGRPPKGGVIDMTGRGFRLKVRLMKKAGMLPPPAPRRQRRRGTDGFGAFTTERPAWLGNVMRKYAEDVKKLGLDPYGFDPKAPKLLGCGSEGCVFEGKPGRIYKLGASPREAELSQKLILLAGAGDAHPSLVRNFAVYHFPDPVWGTAHGAGLIVIERERLTFDHERSDAALGVLSWTEAYLGGYGVFDGETMVRRVKDPAAVVARALAEPEASEFSAEAVRQGIQLFSALKWGYAHGFYVGDLWAIGLGIGYGSKPENVGFRGDTAVIADLGVWKAVGPKP